MGASTTNFFFVLSCNLGLQLQANQEAYDEDKHGFHIFPFHSHEKQILCYSFSLQIY
jgi:hypothetical protein